MLTPFRRPPGNCSMTRGMAEVFALTDAASNVGRSAFVVGACARTSVFAMVSATTHAARPAGNRSRLVMIPYFYTSCPAFRSYVASGFNRTSYPDLNSVVQPVIDRDLE